MQQHEKVIQYLVLFLAGAYVGSLCFTQSFLNRLPRSDHPGLAHLHHQNHEAFRLRHKFLKEQEQQQAEKRKNPEQKAVEPNEQLVKKAAETVVSRVEQAKRRKEQERKEEALETLTLEQTGGKKYFVFNGFMPGRLGF